MPESVVHPPASAPTPTRFEKLVDGGAWLLKNYAIPGTIALSSLSVGLLGFLASDEGVAQLANALSIDDAWRSSVQGWLTLSLVAAYLVLFVFSGLGLWFNSLLTDLRDDNEMLQLRLTQAQDEVAAVASRHGDEVAGLQQAHEEARAAMLSLWRENLALMLQVIAREHSLGTSERVSLYLHEGGRFRLVARYSANTELCKFRRAAYPDDQGCLAKAWQHQSYCTTIKYDPESNADQYYSRQEKEGVPRQLAEQFRMKSRSYAAKRLDRGKPVAVLLFESTNQTGLSSIAQSSGTLDLRDHHVDVLIQSIASVNPDAIPESRHALALERGLVNGGL